MCCAMLISSLNALRCVYRLLSSCAFLVGLWRNSGSSTNGFLYEFHWGVDCITGTALQFGSMRCAQEKHANHCVPYADWMHSSR